MQTSLAFDSLGHLSIAEELFGVSLSVTICETKVLLLTAACVMIGVRACMQYIPAGMNTDDLIGRVRTTLVESLQWESELGSPSRM